MNKNNNNQTHLLTNAEEDLPPTLSDGYNPNEYQNVNPESPCVNPYDPTLFRFRVHYNDDSNIEYIYLYIIEQKNGTNSTQEIMHWYYFIAMGKEWEKSCILYRKLSIKVIK